MRYKVVGYQGANIYYVVCQEVQQTVYCPKFLNLNEEVEATLDYTKLVSGYPRLMLNGFEHGMHQRNISRGIQ